MPRLKEPSRAAGAQAWLAAAVLAACASAPPGAAPGAASLPEPVAVPRPGVPPVPLLRLPPALLGRTLALHQQIDVQARGRSQQIEVLLEADPQQVRLGVLAAGQVAARLGWDGRSLTERHAAWWPAAVSAERILSDLQYTLWPADAVRAALPAGWQLEDRGGTRELRWAGQPVLTVSHPAPGRTDLVQARDGYTLHIESHAADEAAADRPDPAASAAGHPESAASDAGHPEPASSDAGGNR